MPSAARDCPEPRPWLAEIQSTGRGLRTRRRSCHFVVFYDRGQLPPEVVLVIGDVLVESFFLLFLFFLLRRIAFK